jgi:hypothetical protein
MEDSEPGIVPDDGQLDYSWVTERFAVGGATWNRANTRQLAKGGITHIVDLQTTVDDTKTAEGMGIEVLWCPLAMTVKSRNPSYLSKW